MPNIKFNYLYRDGANYKKYGFVIFANPNNIDLSGIERMIRSRLIDGTWFYAKGWSIPEIFLDSFSSETDPTWHEFESIEYCENLADDLLSIDEFISVSECIESIERVDIQTPPNHQQKLDSRLARYEKGETTFFSWNEIKSDLNSK